MKLTISGYSTALFSTWYFVEELGLLLDAGDGVIPNLLQKSRKIKSVFISHADRDHLSGLLQLNQLNARPGYPKIYYPKDSLSIAAFENFTKKFDPKVKATEWSGLAGGQETAIRKDILVTSVRNNHVAAAVHLSKSFGYLVQLNKHKLKPGLLHLSKKEIIDLRKDRGDDFVMDEVRENIIAYSGDTPVENFSAWNNTQILIHESTFLNRHEMNDDDARRNKHSVLEEVLEAASGIHIGMLILGHFSSRYKREEIDYCIKKSCKQFKINFPVFRLLPGEYVHDITGSAPLNNQV